MQSETVVHNNPFNCFFAVMLVVILISLAVNAASFRMVPVPQVLRSCLHANRGFGSNDDVLLPAPAANALGNFFEKSDQRFQFIQCYMVALAKVKGAEYGVGFPMDIPVMLTYFEDDELKPVTELTYPKHYDHLLDYVGNQLDFNGVQLLRTPLVLTLQGEFEDEEFNNIYSGLAGLSGQKDGDEDDEEYEEEYEEEEELSLPELIKREDERLANELDDDDDEEYDEDEDYDDDETEPDDDDNDDEDVRVTMLGDDDETEPDTDDDNVEDINLGNLMNTSPIGKLDKKFRSTSDYDLIKPNVVDTTDLDPEAFVTDEDAKGLRRAHKKADRVLEYAKDVKLMASFHYRKRNFHLVRLLEVFCLVHSHSLLLLTDLILISRF